MTISLRDAIIARVKGKDEKELQEVIEDSVDGAELALPGLGVLLEIVWNNSDSAFKETFIKNLEKGLE